MKELIQLRRDRITLPPCLYPLVQLMLFGYAINTDPKHLPTAVLIQDDSVFTRSFIAALRTSEYFDVRTVAQGESIWTTYFVRRGAVRSGDPANFGRDLIRGEYPRSCRCGRYRSSRYGNGNRPSSKACRTASSPGIWSAGGGSPPRRRLTKSVSTADTTRPVQPG